MMRLADFASNIGGTSEQQRAARMAAAAQQPGAASGRPAVPARSARPGTGRTTTVPALHPAAAPAAVRWRRTAVWPGPDVHPGTVQDRHASVGLGSRWRMPWRTGQVCGVLHQARRSRAIFADLPVVISLPRTLYSHVAKTRHPEQSVRWDCLESKPLTGPVTLRSLSSNTTLRRTAWLCGQRTCPNWAKSRRRLRLTQWGISRMDATCSGGPMANFWRLAAMSALPGCESKPDTTPYSCEWIV